MSQEPQVKYMTISGDEDLEKLIKILTDDKVSFEVKDAGDKVLKFVNENEFSRAIMLAEKHGIKQKPTAYLKQQSGPSECD